MFYELSKLKSTRTCSRFHCEISAIQIFDLQNFLWFTVYSTFLIVHEAECKLRVNKALIDILFKIYSTVLQSFKKAFQKFRFQLIILFEHLLKVWSFYFLEINAVNGCTFLDIESTASGFSLLARFQQWTSFIALQLLHSCRGNTKTD